MIEQHLENEGRILTIKSSAREGDILEVYWNGDTPEYSKEVARGEEIFIVTHSKRSYKSHISSISLSVIEARYLRDTLDYMINKLEE